MKRKVNNKKDEVNFIKISTRTTRIVYLICQLLIFGTTANAGIKLEVKQLQKFAVRGIIYPYGNFHFQK